MSIVDHLVADLAARRIRSVAFVVPCDVETTAPLYDIAIATARRGWQIGIDDVNYWFITPEAEPVESVESEGIMFIGSTYAEVEHGCVLLDPPGESIEADRVVSLGDSGGVECMP